MIAGIGCDIVRVERFLRWYDDPRLARRFLHRVEWDLLDQSRSLAVPSIAARFAAKEAFAKACAVGLRGMRLSEIGVVRGEYGEPRLVLEGSALNALTVLGGSAQLSLSHEGEYALAFVVIERRASPLVCADSGR